MREGDEGPTAKVTGDGGLFQSVLHQLIADGEVKGSLRGGNAVYTPAVLLLALDCPNTFSHTLSFFYHSRNKKGVACFI